MFYFLDQPVLGVTGGEAAPNISKVLDEAAKAGVEQVVEAMTLITENRGHDERHHRYGAKST
jgi:2-oxoisovalerate dehydrogenase E1 component